MNQKGFAFLVSPLFFISIIVIFCLIIVGGAFAIKRYTSFFTERISELQTPEKSDQANYPANNFVEKQQNLPSLKLATQQDDNQKLLNLTKTIMENIDKKNYTDNLKYFTSPVGEKDRLVIFSLISSAYRENGKFNPIMSIDKVQVLGSQGQSLVVFNINQKRSTIRLDFQKNGNEWKINVILIGGELDLIKISNSQKQEQQKSVNTGYSNSPILFTLPTGDKIEVEKTLLVSKNESINFKMIQPTTAYTIMIYDPPYIRASKEITLNNRFFMGVYSLTLSDYFNGPQGIILIYPGGTNMQMEKEKIDVKPLFEIPFKISAN